MLPIKIEVKIRTLLENKASEYSSSSIWNWRIRTLKEWSYILDALSDDEYYIVYKEMVEQKQFPSSSIQYLIDEVTNTIFSGR